MKVTAVAMTGSVSVPSSKAQENCKEHQSKHYQSDNGKHACNGSFIVEER